MALVTVAKKAAPQKKGADGRRSKYIPKFQFHDPLAKRLAPLGEAIVEVATVSSRHGRGLSAQNLKPASRTSIGSITDLV